jgi:hypothetical protein
MTNSTASGGIRRFRFGVVAPLRTDLPTWRDRMRRIADSGYSTLLMLDVPQWQPAPGPTLAVAAGLADLRVGTWVYASSSCLLSRLSATLSPRTISPLRQRRALTARRSGSSHPGRCRPPAGQVTGASAPCLPRVISRHEPVGAECVGAGQRGDSLRPGHERIPQAVRRATRRASGPAHGMTVLNRLSAMTTPGLGLPRNEPVAGRARPTTACSVTPS